MVRSAPRKAIDARLLGVFTVVFVDLLGFGLILPLLPYYARAYGATEATVGLLVASYAAMQLVAAPLLGRLSDRAGRRPVLVVSVAGSAVGFGLLAAAEGLSPHLAGRLGLDGRGWALALLFAGRLVSGATGGNLSVAQAYVADITGPQGRTQGFGLVGAAFGLGFILGPALGGFLSRWGYSLPAVAAGLLAVVNLAFIVRRLPEPRPPDSAGDRPVGRPGRVLRSRGVAALLAVRVLFSLAFGVFQTMFPLYALLRFRLSGQDTGLILSYVGVLLVFTQAFLVGRLGRRLPESRLIPAGLALMTLSLLGWALAPSVPWLLLVLVPASVAGGLLNTVLNAALSRAAGPEQVGAALGLGAAGESLMRVVAPVLGGLLMERLGTAGPGLFAAALLLGLSALAVRVLREPRAAGA